MGFLDYAGQVVLDMVLTDAGRARLAKNDGSFRIAKFAIGDSVINYKLYDPNNPGGEAYYDEQILQTPVFEAITDNALAMSSKLISINKTNLLYLPVVKLNDKFEQSCQQHINLNMHVVCVDALTEAEFAIDVNSNQVTGIMKGENVSSGGYIRIDQGLDTAAISPGNTLDADLLETQYMISIDNRFAMLVDRDGVQASPNSVDDDNIASYLLTMGANGKYVKKNEVRDPNTSSEVIRGPRGSFLQFKIKASIDLNSTTALFAQLGSAAVTDAFFAGAHGIGIAYSFIDAIVRVQGGTTGITQDVPVRFVKLT
jgi:hypothetical protein